MIEKEDREKVLETVLGVLHELLKTQEVLRKQCRSIQSQLDDLSMTVKQLRAINYYYNQQITTPPYKTFTSPYTWGGTEWQTQDDSFIDYYRKGFSSNESLKMPQAKTTSGT